MKTKILLAVLLSVVFIAGCTSSSTNSQKYVTPNESSTESSVVKEDTLFTESLVFNKPNLKGHIIKNKILKTFFADLEFYINDSMENVDFFNGNVSVVPFTVNFMCRFFVLAMFNETALNELYQEGNISSSESEPFWKGYTAVSSHIDFIDAETNEKIGECEATGENWEDLKFKAYRNYDESLFGWQIGQLESTE